MNRDTAPPSLRNAPTADSRSLGIGLNAGDAVPHECEVAVVGIPCGRYPTRHADYTSTAGGWDTWGAGSAYRRRLSHPCGFLPKCPNYPYPNDRNT